MIDHLNLPVADLAASKRFYEAALAPLGFGLLREAAGSCGIGPVTGAGKWIGTLWLREETGFSSLHIAFRASDRRTVDAFYAAAIAAGGKDNGAPGLRPQYHDSYYGAFVLDPNGHSLEVVCHEKA